MHVLSCCWRTCLVAMPNISGHVLAVLERFFSFLSFLMYNSIIVLYCDKITIYDC